MFLTDSTSDSRGYTAPFHFAKILQNRTSDVPKPLCAMCKMVAGMK